MITTCPLPVCAQQIDPAVAAAKLLGWKVTLLNEALSPEAVVAGWQQTLQKSPNLILYGEILPDKVVSKYIAQAGAKRIPIVESAPEQNIDSASPSGPVYGQASGYPDISFSGRLMGDSVVADAGLGAKTLWITDPTLPTLGPAEQAFAQVVTSAGGSVDNLDVSSNDIGKSIPSQIVGYVQSHPDVRYLAFALNDLIAGVPQALQAAGLGGKVKILSRAPAAANIADIQSGAQWLTVAEETGAAGLRGIDQLASVLEHVPISNANSNPIGWHQIIIKANAGTQPVVPPTPGDPSVFYKAWHLPATG